MFAVLAVWALEVFGHKRLFALEEDTFLALELLAVFFRFEVCAFWALVSFGHNLASGVLILFFFALSFGGQMLAFFCIWSLVFSTDGVFVPPSI